MTVNGWVLQTGLTLIPTVCLTLITDISNILIIAEHNTNHLISIVVVNPTYVLRYTEYILQFKRYPSIQQ